MKRTPFILSLTFLAVYFISYSTGQNNLIIVLLTSTVICLLILNLLLRKKLRFKNWFLSPINLLVEKKKYEIDSDISKSLLFEKVLEVVDVSKFKLLDTDKEKFQILSGTSINFLTWGENIYIDLIQKKVGTTTVQFTSTTLFGLNSWNRNEDNYTSFISLFEESLTI